MKKSRQKMFRKVLLIAVLALSVLTVATVIFGFIAECGSWWLALCGLPGLIYIILFGYANTAFKRKRGKK